ncbi:class A beta-lactamase [Nocardia transvalensis]|uniref:class A beta-lactamase n=1 Tax=Nocardia transvalensis TaxID=37333 RepID=UPI001894BD06|nr:class A beta-lactamase [Nocardia transvalensis]MBF6330306.1 class A beta-lactamase [Nocardia transvalensis]
MRSGGIDPGRRALLSAALLVPLAACTKAPTASPPGTAPPPVSDPAAHFAEMERKFDARLGIFAVATGTGNTLAYRADERFAFCSTFKALAAAAVLSRNPLSHLDTRVTFTRDDIRSISPITQTRVDSGMTIGELCDAAVRYSDGTAGNLLLDDIGGTAGLTDYLRSLGDRVGRMDHYEPELNRVAPGDEADTTTPRAIAADYRALILGSALPDDKRALLTDWLRRNVTGSKRIRAATPEKWSVADKTGTGDYGRANDIAIVWPPTGAPLVLAIMSDRPGGYDAPPSDDLIAESARHIFTTLT